MQARGRDRVRVGICAWADPALIESGAFYPRKSMTAEARLRFYASVFDTVEVNSSYYAIPGVRNTARWVERTPPGFVFHVKAYSLMTGHHPRAESVPAELRALLPLHPRRTRRGEVEASSFPPEALDVTFTLFSGALAPIAEAGKLGYVLFQFAPWVRFEPVRLDYLASLPARLPGWTIAVEFRHPSWFPGRTADTLKALAEARLAHVIVDGPVAVSTIPRVTIATTRAAVFRLHGRNAAGWLRQVHGEEPAVREKYDYLYSEAELRELLPEVEGMADEADEVFVSFNNNNRDYPVRNALMLKRLLGQSAGEPGGGVDALPGDLFA